MTYNVHVPAGFNFKLGKVYVYVRDLLMAYLKMALNVLFFLVNRILSIPSHSYGSKCKGQYQLRIGFIIYMYT